MKWLVIVLLTAATVCPPVALAQSAIGPVGGAGNAAWAPSPAFVGGNGFGRARGMMNGSALPAGVTAGAESPARRVLGVRSGLMAPPANGVTAGMARVAGGPGLSALTPAGAPHVPIGSVPGDVSAQGVGTWGGPNTIGLTLGDVSGPLEAIGTPRGLVEQGRPLRRPGIATGGSRAGTPAAFSVGGVGMAAGVPEPNFVGRGIDMSIQPGPNTRVGAGLSSDYSVFGGRVIESGGELGFGYGTNLRTRFVERDRPTTGTSGLVR